MNSKTLNEYIESLRKYRFQFQLPFFNNKNHGIALFDLLLTFIIAYILESYILHIVNITRTAYYLMLIPLGIIIHLLTKQDTFLNHQLFNNEVNIYKLVVGLNIYLLIKELIKN